ncbi:hypothetical protein PV726_47670 [Streptomyces europaeiscabiei]|uniref:hypothetical protein n=1 Tax=Streptomyces europaeiscabiei TaxID=146819 RepID=UPI0029B1342D|nr:hypothetical protein [Streptomyces europaeiscabiei]MDX3697726.1 hypothetical protein [Streptomyces europaeiscabiei]
MASQAGAWVIYLMPRWRSATLLDLARIFDPVPVEQVVTVAEQEAYWQSLVEMRLFSLVRVINPVGWLYAIRSRVNRRKILRRLYC